MAVATISAALVFGLWYPGLYRSVAGGMNLFVLLISVDVVIGPLLTLVIFNVKKPRRELIRDVAIIATLQLAALGYGMHTIFTVRPVAMVFEMDRFRVVTAQDVMTEELATASEPYRRLPLTGPLSLGLRQARDGQEKLAAFSLALQGFDTSMRPSFWEPYALTQAHAAKLARPVSDLITRYPQHKAMIQEALAKARLNEGTARFLPLIARVTEDWVVILNPQGEVAGVAPLDGYF